jgi:hypothetical protein
MTMPSLLDSFDTVSHSEQLLLRLESASAELSKKVGLKEEKAWLETARLRVASAREGVGDLLNRVLRLPELEPVREDHARTLQTAAVDAVERLHAGITFAAGSRAPIIEALYGKLKIPVLRRCDREDFEKFCTDFEKRLNTSYAKRMFGDESFQLVIPALAQLQKAFVTWRGVFSNEPLSDMDAQGLRDELDAVSRRLELPCRQARLLAEAALAPLRELFENSGLGHKPKKRVKSEIDEDASMLDEAPLDPTAPSAEELAELSAPEAPAAEAPMEVVEEAAAPAIVEAEEKPRRARKQKSAEA